MPVVGEARDHMPVQVRYHVAQAGQVDFRRLHQLAQSLLDGKYHAHQSIPSRCIQIGHFAHVPVEDYAAEAGIVAVFDQDYAAQFVLPQGLSTRRIA
jgi:DNA-binding ferritin-like protein